MDAQDQRQEWAELIGWVTWLHDRYELGGRPGLPPCWPQHTGLVEQLRALRAWREEIYARWYHAWGTRPLPLLDRARRLLAADGLLLSIEQTITTSASAPGAGCWRACPA